MENELLIFVGYSDDAKGEALAIRELEPSLGKTLDRLNRSAKSQYSRVKIFNWEYDAKIGVGGQEHAISPELERASVAVFVFRARVGNVTWEELHRCRNRSVTQQIPIIALFPTSAPTTIDFNDQKSVDEWSNLLRKKQELTKDWTSGESKSVTPVPPYEDTQHLQKMVFEKLEDLLSHLVEPAISNALLEQVVSDKQAKNIAGAFDLDHLTDITEYDSHSVHRYRSVLRVEKRSKFPDSLSDSEFLREAGYMKHGRLTTSGVLLFTSQPSRVFPSAWTRCIRYKGTTKEVQRDRRDLEGSLLDQLSQARDFVAQHVEKREGPTGSSMRSETVYQYPMICVREVIANALCHRKYDDNERIVYVRLFSDRIEVSSPGCWIGENPPEEKQISLGSLISEPIQRNMRLARAISDVGFMEMEGSGIPTAIRDCKNVGASEATMIERDGYVTIVIHPRKEWHSDTKETSSTSSLWRSGGRKGTITLRQTSRDPDFKGMISGLKNKRSFENQYYGRSESDVAKMILMPGLFSEYKRLGLDDDEADNNSEQ